MCFVSVSPVNPPSQRRHHHRLLLQRAAAAAMVDTFHAAEVSTLLGEIDRLQTYAARLVVHNDYLLRLHGGAAPTPRAPPPQPCAAVPAAPSALDDGPATLVRPQSTRSRHDHAPRGDTAAPPLAPGHAPVGGARRGEERLERQRPQRVDDIGDEYEHDTWRWRAKDSLDERADGGGGGGGVAPLQRGASCAADGTYSLPPPPPWHHPSPAPPPEGSRVVEKLLVQSYVIMRKLTELETSAAGGRALLREVRRRASQARSSDDDRTRRISGRVIRLELLPALLESAERRARFKSAT